ncbi:MAG: WYL domain-containing protein [Propionibacteriaceae bacterium]|nr:WYL domain-containing protein [Propionibacteriaceae bacterium]
MASRKSERILNLTICLLSARRFLSREQIRAAVEGYAGLGDAAFERMFERDKEELRRLGVPVETGSQSSYFDDELGYRIPRGDFELPPIEFTADEAAVVSMAGRVWQEANLAESTQLALAKLRAAGLATPQDSGLLAPTSTARVAAFEPLWRAVVAGRRVRFDYRRGGAEHAAQRLVEPWAIVSHKGNWYLIGHDVDRDDTRMFKLARICDEPVAEGRAGAVVVPKDLDLRALAERLEPGRPSGEAIVAIRAGRVPWLRRRGRAVADPPVPSGGRLPSGFEAYAVGFDSLETVSGDLAAAGSEVIVLAPAELRARVRHRLAAVAAGSPAPAEGPEPAS